MRGVSVVQRRTTNIGSFPSVPASHSHKANILQGCVRDPRRWRVGGSCQLPYPGIPRRVAKTRAHLLPLSLAKLLRSSDHSLATLSNNPAAAVVTELPKIRAKLRPECGRLGATPVIFMIHRRHGLDSLGAARQRIVTNCYAGFTWGAGSRMARLDRLVFSGDSVLRRSISFRRAAARRALPGRRSRSRR